MRVINRRIWTRDHYVPLISTRWHERYRDPLRLLVTFALAVGVLYVGGVMLHMAVEAVILEESLR